MISFYKWKKQIIFVLLGTIPFVSFVFLLFMSIKYYSVDLEGFEGFRFMQMDSTGVIVAFLVAIVSIVVLILLGNKWLRHPFTDMLEGKGLVTFIIDSTGVIGSFIAKIDAPTIEAIKPGKTIEKIEDIYDADILHRLLVPKDATITQAISYESVPGSDAIKLSEPVNVLVLPKQLDDTKHLFSFMNKPVLIFNKVMNQFLSRDGLAKFEKDIQIKHNALNILAKLQATSSEFKIFGRYIGESIKPKKTGMFGGSPWIKWIILAGVIGLIALIIAMFVPGILDAGQRVM